MKERRYLPLTVPFRATGAGRPPQGRDRRQPMAKFHARPSLQYRYEHYDPFLG
jgi:hypothetical protein